MESAIVILENMLAKKSALKASAERPSEQMLKAFDDYSYADVENRICEISDETERMLDDDIAELKSAINHAKSSTIISGIYECSI